MSDVRGGGLCPLLLLPLLLLVPERAAYAQHVPAVSASCDGAIVSAIEVKPNDPLDLSVPRGFHWLAGVVGLMHTTSKTGVIGRFLLLEVGEVCTEILRAESERILRMQPFLADATVRAMPVAPGAVRIEVETVDEIAVIFGLRLRGLTPQRLRFGNGNVGGQGLSLAADVERRSAYRTGIGLRGVATQSFGRPYRIEFLAERRPVGSAASIGFGHPFFTDLQRTAWHTGVSNSNRYLPFLPPEGDELSLGVRRRFWDLGVVRRLGLGRRSAFGGVLVTREAVTPADRVVIVSDSGLVVDESDSLGAPWPAYRNLRLNAVLGVRALSFMPVTAFDALKAVQDVATGLQVGILVGRGIPRFGDDGGDLFLSTDLYAGVGSARSFAAMRIEGEGRREGRTNRWGSIVVGGRLAWYLKPTPERVVIGSVEFGGAARGRVPFQLALGDRTGGVRGYSGSRVTGGWRSVVRLEGRSSIGDLGQHGALGIAMFADAGRVWAGDAPFGVDSGTKLAFGVGVLVAVPPQSQRLWRLDVVVPVSADRHAGWEVRLSSVWAEGFWREPRVLRRARAGAAPSTIFTWL